MADVQTLLPPNATAVERALEHATARMGAIPVPVDVLWSSAECPLALLPWLAWSVGVESWRPEWSEATKRAVIAATPVIKRQKGTAAAVRAAVAAFGGALSIREWWQSNPPGPPHTFSVTLTVASADTDALTAQFVDDVVDAIGHAKPLRSHFTFTQGLQANAGVALRGAVRGAVYARLQLPVQEAAH